MTRTATLAGPADFDGFRWQARRLLADGLAPEAVHWRVASHDGELPFDEPDGPPPADGRDPAAAVLSIPRSFLALAREVAMHRDPARFHLLYMLLWRWRERPERRDDPLDPPFLDAQRMAAAVRRDIHKMRAFVRFRPVLDGDGASPLHVAWFEPQHHILQANAPFFARRFAGMRWAILTPDGCLRWDGRRLEAGPPAVRSDAPPADAGEALWLAYYQSTFNPARLKLRTMRREMPRRYWHNLPEATAIAPLAAVARLRTQAMIASEPTIARRRIVPLAVEPSAADPDAGAMQRLARAAAACRDCPLADAATQTVWGEGPPGARLMIVGEQPGDREDLEGRPFVGPAGALLDRAFARLGWNRGSLYLTNAVKHFKYEPRGRRRIHKTPGQREAAACAHWLEREIELVRPRAAIALGATAARQLLGRPIAVLAERGRWHWRADGLPVLVTLHPAALLRGAPAELDAAFECWIADLKQADTADAKSHIGTPLA